MTSSPPFRLGSIVLRAADPARPYAAASRIIFNLERAADGRWTIDAWAPTVGFVANAGIRLNFGGN